jgi:hypothetical protein
MADRPTYPDSTADPGVRPDRGPDTAPASYPGTPRWVKRSAIIAIGLLLLVVAVLVVTTALGLHTPGGPGGHGP